MDRSLQHFYNEGYGWICRKCERELSPDDDDHLHSRLLREGESEGKVPRLSSTALARWSDETRTTLECPHCGVKESLPIE